MSTTKWITRTALTAGAVALAVVAALIATRNDDDPPPSLAWPETRAAVDSMRSNICYLTTLDRHPNMHKSVVGMVVAVVTDGEYDADDYIDDRGRLQGFPPEYSEYMGDVIDECRSSPAP